MATVTVLTAERMLEIEAESIVGGAVDPVTGHLILVRHNGTVIDAGPVVSTGNFVDVITDQAIDGVKTFSSPPVVPANAFPQAAVAGLASSFNSKADDSATVHKTGAEAIAGVKTFSAAPVVPPNSFPESAINGLATDLSRYVICTSSTRPSAPFAGQRIFETNTSREYVWTGSLWSYRSGGIDPTYVHAYRNTALNAPGGWSGIILDSETSDVSSLHTGVGGYICPETRMYHVSARVKATANNTPQRFIVALAINGVTTILGEELMVQGLTGTEPFGLVLSTVAPLTAGDAIQLQLYNGEANACAITAAGETWMKVRAA